MIARLRVLLLLCACVCCAATARTELGVLAPVLRDGEPAQKNDPQGHPAPVVTRVQSGELYDRLQKETSEGFTGTILALDESAQRMAGGGALVPTWLYLSAEDGGFARAGFWLVEDGKERYVPDAFVDLVVDKDIVEDGGFEEIFAHEMGHVFLRRLLPKLPQGYSRTPHGSLAITDDPTAFDEGFAIHFQGLARRLTHNAALHDQDLGLAFKPFVPYWQSNIDRTARIDGVRRNVFVQAQLVLPGDGDPILRRDNSTLFDTARLKNGNQMLAAEGVLATLFYRWLVPGPADEAALLQRYGRLFAALVALNKHELRPESRVFIDLLDRFAELHPDQAASMWAMVLDTTYGATADTSMVRESEALAAHGRLGDMKTFVTDLKPARATMATLRDNVTKSPMLLRAALGPDIWLLVRDKPELSVNLNTAELEHLTALKGVDAAAAERALRSRRNAGPFRDVADFAARSGLDAQTAKSLDDMKAAMKRAGVNARR